MKSQITVHTCFALIASTFWFSCKDDSYVDEEERGEKTKKHFRDGVIFYRWFGLRNPPLCRHYHIIFQLHLSHLNG